MLCIWPKIGQITHTSKLFIIAHQSSTCHCWVVACPPLLSIVFMLKNNNIVKQQGSWMKSTLNNNIDSNATTTNKRSYWTRKGPRSLAIHFTMDNYNDQGTKERKQSQFCSISWFNCFQWKKMIQEQMCLKTLNFLIQCKCTCHPW